MKRIAGFAVVLVVLVTMAARLDAAETPQWKAGVAAVKITPQVPMPMAGYAARKQPSEGVALDLNAKALALEDARGTRLVIVAIDLLYVPRTMRDSIEKIAQEKYKLAPQSLLLNASHTHCGPEFRANRLENNGAAEETRKAGEDYGADLERKLVALIGESLDRLEPANLDFLRARAGFAMNRRRLTEKGYVIAPNSEGPVDHEVPVLRVSDGAGKLRAIVFGYACHNTTLAYLKFCGDYAGFAQQCLQEAHPEAMAMFITGCGADQNPYPRGTEELAQQHGRTLATAVEAALQTEARPVRGPLASVYGEVEIPFAPRSREELEKIAAEKKGAEQSHAQRMLKQWDKDGKLRESYPYRVQVVRFGDDLLLVALAGEVLVDYSLRLKRELAGPTVWVAGYSNDVFGYVPSARVLREGGYEAASAVFYGSLPGPFAESIEEQIVAKVRELAEQAQKAMAGQ